MARAGISASRDSETPHRGFASRDRAARLEIGEVDEFCTSDVPPKIVEMDVV